MSPALRSFWWFDVASVQECFGAEVGRLLSPYMALFLGDSVEELDVAFGDYDFPLHKASVKLAVKRCHPRIRKLSVCYNAVMQHCALFPWPKLEQLIVRHVSSTDALSFPALGQLSALQLWFLRSHSDSLHLPGPNILRAGALTSLRELVVRCSNFDDTRQYIDLLPRDNCLRILELYSLMILKGIPYQDVIDRVGRRCNPLTTIILEEGRFYGDVAEELDMDPRQIDLSPLVPFRLLEQLQIRMHEAVSITPKLVEQIPYFWPHLQRLFLSHEITTSRLPSIDHTHVLQLVRGLPALRDLGIRFDATAITEEDTGPTLPPPRLHALRIGLSPIYSPSRALHFLRHNFPSLEILDISHMPRLEEGALYKRRWECVLEGWKAVRMVQ